LKLDIGGFLMDLFANNTVLEELHSSLNELQDSL
jgi:hypothetical protein